MSLRWDHQTKIVILAPAKILGTRTESRWIIGWIGCRGSRRAVHGRDWNRHRRIHSSARSLLRINRDQTHIWSNLPMGHDRFCVKLRSSRTNDPLCSRCSFFAPGHVGQRPQRFNFTGRNSSPYQSSSNSRLKGRTIGVVPGLLDGVSSAIVEAYHDLPGRASVTWGNLPRSRAASSHA